MLRLTPVDVLILGAGWTSQFLIPLLEAENVIFAATTTTGRDNTIPFKFDSDSNDLAPYKKLPLAKTILITFPLKGEGQSKHLVTLYRQTHQRQEKPDDSDDNDSDDNNSNSNWVQLGSTGIFTAPHWNDHTSPYNKDDPRAIAEDELLSLGGYVLNLAGLYGGQRNPKNWVTRVATTKAQVKSKAALHLIHGSDVARAILALHRKLTTTTSPTTSSPVSLNSKPHRWLLTDLRTYDWWDLISTWAPSVERRASLGDDPRVDAQQARELAYERWVGELMQEEGVRALPRSPKRLGRVLDSRAFWVEVGVWPGEGRVGS